MAIHGFAFWKFAKPDDEHHLQACPTLRKPRFVYHDRSRPLNLTNNNTDGWGNKLVTIFARYPDSFIVTIKLSIIYQNRDYGSKQILPTGQLSGSPGWQKLRHTLLAP